MRTMDFFGIDLGFHIMRPPGKNDPIVPFQFKGARRPRSHWPYYLVIFLVMSLVGFAFFAIGMDLVNPIP